MTDDDARAILETLLKDVKALGADAADAVLAEAVSVGVSYRLGKVEDIERSEAQDLGLRVMVGKRQAIVSSTDHAPETLKTLAERCVAMAKTAPEEPYCGFAPADKLAKAPFLDLDLHDPVEPSSEALADKAKAAEDAALAVKGVTNSIGASAGWGSGAKWLMTTDGFFGSTKGTNHSVSASVLAGEGAAMERDYDYSSARHGADLKTPEDIGQSAGDRAVRRLGAKKPKSQKAPVVFDNRLASSLIGHFAGAINGGAIARGVSFLKDKMGETLFAKTINIIDDPHIKRGAGSRAFDGEGAVNAKRALIENGVLTGWVLNSAHARQLGLETTGNSTRGTGGPPGAATSNLYMEAGPVSRDDLISDIAEGLLITDMFGPQVNPNTGDYSCGVSGLWIENGGLAYPVSEITVAGNILDMFKNLTPANDLEFRGSTNAPTLRVEGMTIAGD